MINGMIIHPSELSKEWIDKLSDAKINVLGLHPPGGDLAISELENLVEIMKTNEYRTLIDYALSKEIKIEYEIHAAGYLMPKSMFETHPEYFRMNEKGERTKDHNFCVSCTDALDLFAERAAELAISLYGSSHDFYFWMDDGRSLQCHCPKCKNLTASDQQLIAVNAMQRAIRKRIPDARMAYLAYVDSIIPPKKTKPSEGVFLEYAPFEKYTAKGEDAPVLIKREKEMLSALLNFFGKRGSKVLEYWYDNSLYSNWKKPPVKFTLNDSAMRTDIAEYRSFGFEGIATFACYLGRDYEILHGSVDITPFADCTR